VEILALFDAVDRTDPEGDNIASRTDPEGDNTSLAGRTQRVNDVSVSKGASDKHNARWRSVCQIKCNKCKSNVT
jgi:hypothetical protein